MNILIALGSIVVGAYLLILTVWCYYLVAMKLKSARDWAKEAGYNPSPVITFHSYLLLAIGAPFYVALNLTLATVLFLDLPREIEFTKRCQRYIKEGGGWRKGLAKWTCRHWLDPFDDGEHC